MSAVADMIELAELTRRVAPQVRGLSTWSVYRAAQTGELGPVGRRGRALVVGFSAARAWAEQQGATLDGPPEPPEAA